MKMNTCIATIIWQQLQDVAKPVDIKRHQYLYNVGDDADKVHFITSGLILLTRLMDDGREVGQILMTNFNMFSQCEILLNERKREHLAFALTDSRLWSVHASEFTRLIQNSADLALSLARLQSERLTSSLRKLNSMTSQHVSQRVADMLLYLCDTVGTREDKMFTLRPCPTHQDLAIMVASTRETVSAVMGRMRKDHLIDFKRNELQILDEPALRNY